MTMMQAVHAAMRRDLHRLARLAASTAGDDPRIVLRNAVGWEMFKSFLAVHHTSEDMTVWPVVKQAVGDRADDLAVVAAMEKEHAAIDPLLAAVDAAIADSNDPSRLADVIDALAVGLSDHLRHEEASALPLIDRTLTPAQWKAFSDDHRARIGSGANRYLPWLLDEATPEAVAGVLSKIPEPLLRAYETEWLSAYGQLRPWSARSTASESSDRA
jgi:iron-sulfur cluster repair protein YtfE (RIC family)